MAVSRSRASRFVAIIGGTCLLVGAVTACTDGGGDAPSFTTTQSRDDSTPSSSVAPSTSPRPDGDDSEIGNGNGGK